MGDLGTAAGRLTYGQWVRRDPFITVGRYRDLSTLGAAWQDVHAEALTTVPNMSAVNDGRVGASDWRALPLWVEPEDRGVFPDEVCEKNRRLAPLTVSLVEALGPVEACSFSLLAPGGAIAKHRHDRPFATAALCLDGGENARIRVAGVWRSYINGEWIIFDYTKPHEVTNDGPRARIVLLVLLDLRG